MAKLKLILAMVIFGTIGLFVRQIPLSSTMIAMVRGAVGAVFLLIMSGISRQPVSGESVKKNLLVLILSGSAIGINWILLFEAYRYTTVATATLCYYLAPVIVTLLSPIVLKEKLTGRKVVCAAAALLGMVMVSGVLTSGPVVPGSSGEAVGPGSPGAAGNFTGILFGIGAAAFYAAVILLNKFLKDIDSKDSTVVQLAAAALVLLPYLLGTESVSLAGMPGQALVLLLVVGILHTGIAYRMYFSAVADLSGQTIAIFSYMDPVVAILLSALVLGEHMDGWSVMGAALILGSTFYSEWKGRQDGK